MIIWEIWFHDGINSFQHNNPDYHKLATCIRPTSPWSHTLCWLMKGFLVGILPTPVALQRHRLPDTHIISTLSVVTIVISTSLHSVDKFSI